MLNIPVILPGQERPPFVRFEEREYGINREASEKAGRPIPGVTIMACITNYGSKDVFEKPATEWLDSIRQRAINGQYNPDWYQRFKLQFEEYQKGNELPREGTAIQTWQMLNAEQRARLKAIGIPTVEDLAQIPDSALGTIGLDGRVLRDTAKAWIQEALDKGVNAQTIAAQSERLNALERENEELRARLSRLEDKRTKAA